MRCDSMKEVSGIYLIENKINGKKYIGQSINIYKRFREHCFLSNKNHSYIDNAIHKYGKENFIFKIIEELSKDKNLLNNREKYWIEHYNTFKDDYHYNLTSGGDSFEFSDESLKKISDSLKGEKSFWYGKKNIEHSKRMMGNRNPNWKDYPRLKKKGFSDGKQLYCISFSGKDIIYSIDKDFLQIMIDSNMYLYPFHKKFGFLPKGYYLPHIVFKIPLLLKQYAERQNEPKPHYNSTGYYGVSIKKNSNYKQGFTYKYRWTENGKRREISRININDLEREVKKRGLRWEEL